ncbi:hypothetical protein Y88_0531 [Novosphingobium nitrogenifigens DSM 19370]|uniref:Uncharacterized protein n=1 Tax=Novosphingobium nitrogenifigens DSM 19370 TaxID=983920 RepID=F1ZAC0_9SPHN|nr:hypothetical protein Y88_0531 [Novosphingobium nitrogenifigens DSM 19370]
MRRNRPVAVCLRHGNSSSKRVSREYPATRLRFVLVKMPQRATCAGV